MNQVALIGNLTSDAELKQLPGTDGRMVLEFTIAWTYRSKKEKDGPIEEKPQFVDCVVYGGYAEGLEKTQYMKKGKRVGVEAMLKYETWKSTDGASRSKIRLLVNHVDFLSPMSDVEGVSDE